MIINHIAIKNFRNLTSVDISPHHKINFLTGQNAQGKSSFLEAAGILSTGRSFRRSRDSELINWNESYCRIESCITGEAPPDDDPLRIVIAIARERDHATKKILLNGTSLSHLSQFIGQVKAVSFSRYDLETVAGSPICRRRFIDAIASNISPRYLHTLQKYYSILKERNNWLKSSGYGKHLAIAEVWEEQLAQQGCVILSERVRIIEKLSSLALAVFEKLSPGDDSFALSYRPTFPVNGADQELLYRDFLKALRKQKHLEEVMKSTLVGPHRDDLSITTGDVSTRTYGSQGQQRLVSITLRLAEAELIETSTGIKPILLLDDCFSELDSRTREKLWQYLLKKGQIFVTSNSVPENSPGGEDMQVFLVTEGNVTPLV